MNRDTMMMKAGCLQLALLMMLATAATTLPPPAHAEAAPLGPRATQGILEESGPDADAGIQRWWGVAGAVICGYGIRLARVAPAVGMNPYVLAAGISGCALAALDIVTST